MAVFYKALAAAGGAAVGYGIYSAQPITPMNETIHKVKVCELPLYKNPEDRYRYEDAIEEVGSFRRGISEVRQVVWKYLDTTKESREKITDKFEIGIAHTQSTYAMIKDDPSNLRNIGYIFVAWYGGILLGYKKGIVRKFLFSSTLALTAASLCYPNKAVDITTNCYNKIYNRCKQDFTKLFPSVEKDKKEKEQSKEKKMSDKIEGDMGQSEAEDKDMYTTRKS